jgi:cellulose synthase/poly-beta-1,6-N-acetylglucosamine synthase-like glycosyltransferase
MPIPLGGTSNHFRRSALEAVGGWDPFNVTEDADLGLRLARLGYRSGTLDLPTLEEAPAAVGPWLRQRTRWFKGWMQTWLVHTRDPRRLARELGPRGSLGFTLIGTGLIVSSLIYPVYLVTLVAMATNPLGLWGDGGILAAVVIGVNLFNLVAGYVAMAMLSGRALKRRGRRIETGGLILLPLYWLLMSLASYRAVFELALRPHHWAKTPHSQRHGAWSRRE